MAIYNISIKKVRGKNKKLATDKSPRKHFRRLPFKNPTPYPVGNS